MTSWAITITAPTGNFDALIDIDHDQVPAVGEMRAKNGSGPMEDLKVDANTIQWSTMIERPMPMKLTFKGKHGYGAMSGTVKFGIFASGTFAGTRA